MPALTLTPRSPTWPSGPSPMWPTTAQPWTTARGSPYGNRGAPTGTPRSSAPAGSLPVPGAGPSQTYSHLEIGPDGMTARTVPNPINQTWDEAHADQIKQLALESDIEDLYQKKLAGQYMTRMGPSAQARAMSGGGAGSGQAPSIEALASAIRRLQSPLPAQIPAPSVPTSTVPRPTLADTSRAENLAYGQAKNRIASEFAAANKGLTRSLTARGVSGTGIENRNRRELTRASLGALGQAAAEQAARQAQRADEFTRMGYQGDLSQRAQDINAILARFNALLSQRGQDIAAQPNPAAYIGPLIALQQAGGSL